MTWTSSNYNFVVFSWSQLDNINIIFFSVAAYFVATTIRKKDITLWEKLFLAAITLPGFYITFKLGTVVNFDQSFCNVTNSDFLTYYKLIQEFICIGYVLVAGIFELLRKAKDKMNWQQISIVASAFILFLSIFAVTEYLASEYAGVAYTVSLYGLFVLPVFLFLVILSIVRFQVFEARRIGTQLLVYVMIIMVGTQFLFLENSTNRILNGITLVLAVVFGYLLSKNISRENAYTEKIEKLATDLQAANARLEELDKQKSEFVSFATHQLRSPLTSIRGNASLILEGDLGPVSDGVRQTTQIIATSIRTMINIVEDYLNISRIELGTMKYNLTNMDFKDLAKEVMSEQKSNVDAKGLTYTLSLDETQTYKIKADPDKFKQVVMNTIDNSIKYTPKGSLAISLTKDPARNVIRLKIADTGVGIAPNVMPKLFQKFSRAANANEANIHGTGLGLYIAKEIMNAHSGKIWAESDGEGKGSQFYIEVPEAR